MPNRVQCARRRRGWRSWRRGFGSWKSSKAPRSCWSSAPSWRPRRRPLDVPAPRRRAKRSILIKRGRFGGPAPHHREPECGPKGPKCRAGCTFATRPLSRGALIEDLSSHLKATSSNEAPRYRGTGHPRPAFAATSKTRAKKLQRPRLEAPPMPRRCRLRKSRLQAQPALSPKATLVTVLHAFQCFFLSESVLKSGRSGRSIRSV